MTFLYINPNPRSTNARLLSLEKQLVDGGLELNVDLRDRYMMVFHNRANGVNVQADLLALERDLADRSFAARGEVQRIVQHLMEADPSIQLNHWLQINPDYYTHQGVPFWDFNRSTPLRWFGSGYWVPPTEWRTSPASQTAMVPYTGMNEYHQSQLSQPIGPNPPVNNSSQVVGPYTGPNLETSNSNQSSMGQYIAPNPAFMNQNHNNMNTTTVAPPPRLFPIFQPARAVRVRSAPIISADVQRRLRMMGYNFNPNWEGEIDEYALRNQSCPENQNCSLFITKLHRDASDFEFFSTINEGPVFSMHRKPPGAGISTSAVSLVFMTREAAVLYHDKGNSGAGIVIRGIRLIVRWNRERVWPVLAHELRQSRVLLIHGPEQLVNSPSILRYLRGVLTMVITHEFNWQDGPGRLLCEVGFGSIRGQSRAAVRALSIELQTRCPRDHFSIEYGPDPCDPNPLLSHPHSNHPLRTRPQPQPQPLLLLHSRPQHTQPHPPPQAQHRRPQLPQNHSRPLLLLPSQSRPPRSRRPEPQPKGQQPLQSQTLQPRLPYPGNPGQQD